MGRWKPDARGRLQQASLELYEERGFEQTTVADLAERAGVTERTFFRHFADKREVLFDAQDALGTGMVAALTAADADAGPIEAIGAALDAAGAVLDAERRPYARRRRAVIVATPALREREAYKLSHLAEQLGAALGARGVAQAQASALGQLAVGAFHIGFESWVAAPDSDARGLEQHARAALDAMAAAFRSA